MAPRAESAADLTRLAVGFARAMTIGMRTWGFYPPEHPAVGMAVERLMAAAGDACGGGLMMLGVTPHGLLLDGQPVESTDLGAIECAALLHDRDILQLVLVSPPDDQVVRSLLSVLSLERNARRAQGGPAEIWAGERHSAILLEQIDYQQILEREFDDEGPARRDATWKSIVRSIIVGRTTFTVEEQQRLLEVSRDIGAIGELSKDAKEAFTTPDGSPLVTTQAATVLAVYRHIATAVAALEPERAQEVMDSLALAAGGLDPSTATELLMRDDGGDGGTIVAAIRQSFDDQQIAMLLARAISAPGHPAGRLAQVLDTLAPDDDRKRRVLTLAKKLVGERDLSNKRPIDDIRKSLDELLLKYDESTYVSADYRQSMDTSGARAADLATRGLPAEMKDWLDTLGHNSVRRLSGQLLIDLLRNETKADRLADTARDMGAFAEELIMAGAFDEAVPVIEELAAAAVKKPPLAPDACRASIDGVARSSAVAESASAIGDQTAQEHRHFERLVLALGCATVTALVAAYQREDNGAATERVTNLLVKLGPPAIPGIAAIVDEQRWVGQREIAKVLGQIGTAAAVPPLQGMLRRNDSRVLPAAVSAIARIDDPAAARALHNVMRSATGDARAAVISALVALKHIKVVPLLMRVVSDSDPFGNEHQLVLDTLAAIASLQDDRAIPPVVTLARQRRWLSWGKTKRLREASLRALARIGSAKSHAAVDDLRRTGDYFLRRMAARLPVGTT